MRTPEGNQYLDTGCKLYPSCLDCPLPVCAEDIESEERITPKQRAKYIRNNRIMKLVDQGKNIRSIAREIKVSVRTVQRVIIDRGEGG